MTDFQFYSSLASKRTARYTGHKKCGAKSKKCTLSTDFMTQKQLERMNGPMSSYSLRTPMEWDNFKSMPSDLQKAYLSGLTQSYNVTVPRLAEMFGVCAPTVRKFLEANNLVEEVSLDATGKIRRMSKQDLMSWNTFLLGKDDIPVVESPAGKDTGDSPPDNTTKDDYVDQNAKALNLPEDERERLIDAEWQQPESMTGSEKYMAEIRIYANNRIGMFVDLSKVFTERQIDILSMNVKTSKQGKATISMSFEIHGIDELNSLIEKLRQINGVLDIARNAG